MTWTIINSIVICVGLCLICYAKHIDSSENYGALMFGMTGLTIAGVSVISFVVELVIFYTKH